VTAGDLLARDMQLEWRGTLLGSGTLYRTFSLEGWQDLPAVRGSNPALSGFHGAQQGQLLAEPRSITWIYKLSHRRPEFQAAVRELRRITALTENPVEEQLALQVDGQRFMVMARCHRRAIPTDKQYALGYMQGAVQWVSTNPRQWMLPRKTAQARLASDPSGGLIFPLVFPLDFGQAVSGGEFPAELVNAGNVDAWPVWRITGPVQGPVITNLSGMSLLRFNPSWSLPAGQVVEIDTRPGARTVTFVDPTTFKSLDISATGQLWTRAWFPIPAGGSVRVGFTSAGSYQAAATLDALWYDENM
jgi:hypothetical protein